MGEAAREHVRREHDPARAAEAVVEACRAFRALPPLAERPAAPPPPSSLTWHSLAGRLEVEGAEGPWPPGERRRLRLRLANTGFARWLAGHQRAGRGRGRRAALRRRARRPARPPRRPPLAAAAARPRAGRGDGPRDRGAAAAGPGRALGRAARLSGSTAAASPSSAAPGGRGRSRGHSAMHPERSEGPAGAGRHLGAARAPRSRSGAVMERLRRCCLRLARPRPPLRG